MDYYQIRFLNHKTQSTLKLNLIHVFICQNTEKQTDCSCMHRQTSKMTLINTTKTLYLASKETVNVTISLLMFNGLNKNSLEIKLLKAKLFLSLSNEYQ